MQLFFYLFPLKIVVNLYLCGKNRFNSSKMKQLLFLGLLLSVGFICRIHASTVCPDKEIFNRYRETFQEKKELPLNELVTETAKFFLGTPYVGGTLEKEPEQLVANLHELDCTTLVETSLALARTLKNDTLSWNAFCNNLQQIRYHQGLINGYASRKHYASDWIVSNEQQGIVADVTFRSGGEPYVFHVAFMSSHPDKYKQLAADSSLVSLIREKEDELNRHAFYFIPKEKISTLQNQIRNGDIICFTTSIKGLDISHMGYAYWDKGELTFIHASTVARKVIVNPDPLTRYIHGVRLNTGILVVRPL